MSTEATELHWIISASVRNMLDAYRIQDGGAADKTRRDVARIFTALNGLFSAEQG